KLAQKRTDRSLTEKIDRVLLHRAAGFAVFAGVMAVLFMSLFAWAAPMIDGISSGFKGFGHLIHDALGDGIFTDFLVDGVIGGVGAVLVFLPQILMLFLFLGFLEDCGYLARVAYLMDRVMRSMNLHGRAFVPMLFGFACAVPAITATRTMERRRDRLLTMMVVPLMTCSARLPVYTLIIAALVPGSRVTQGLLMVGMYAFSVTTSLVAAWVMSKTVKQLKAKRLPFIIELPPYRFPRMRDVLRMMWSKSSMFLREAGTVILACSVALWALLYFPRHLPAGSPDYPALIAQAPDLDTQAAIEAREHAAHHGERAHALHREREEHHQRQPDEWRVRALAIGFLRGAQRLAQRLRGLVGVGADRIHDTERRHEHLACRERADQADADLPVEAERLDCRLDRVADPAAVAVLEVRGLFPCDQRGLRVVVGSVCDQRRVVR
ncbi:MAG TPA: ferrous iron transporter B, partial [Kofleriaceae bacterium]|nr:ferrous iron transporter B [Kofleriaceae bacterium]